MKSIKTNNFIDSIHIFGINGKLYEEYLDLRVNLKRCLRLRVDLNILIPTQDFINRSGLLELLEDTNHSLPLITHKEGKFYISDGHHRIALAIMKGEKSLLCNVYNLD